MEFSYMKILDHPNAYGMFVGDAQVIIVLEGPHGSTECEIAKEFCA